ncbi:uncharacterized protein LOC113324751 [Papaver somniferum]|uniref:uncharacterized protein LOC113324751 n=1 Tax=Papaver somniferum TaxID=3469 RepID=UPI000E704DB4|nr:uncharacterized protein LOC113324751 [Papaver somniferum]
MEKKRQEEEKSAQEEDGILDLEKQQQEVAQQDVSQTQQTQDSLLVTDELQSNIVLEKIDDGFSSPTRTARRSSPVRTDEVLETSNMFETGIEDSEDEEESIEADALPIKEKPPDSLQSARNVETEAEKLKWSAAKDEEDKLKRELAEKKKLIIFLRRALLKPRQKRKANLVPSRLKMMAKLLEEVEVRHAKNMIRVQQSLQGAWSLKLVDFYEDVITNEVNGEKGNIWILWRNTLLRPDILSTSKQAITVDFTWDFITAVHASYNPVVRNRLWRQWDLGFISIPCLVLGDFNCVLRLEEKKGGRPIKEVYMNEFRSWISDNGLVEADAIGKKYTWSNCRSGAQRIVFKHDRAVVNDAWCYKYANWRCKALPRDCFMQLVEENWSLDLNGAPLFVFTSKLKRLKEVLKIWNRTIFGDVQFRLKQAELKLDTENDLLDYDPADEFQFLRVADAKKDVDDVRTELAIILKMKSRDEIKDYIVNHYQAKFNGGDVHIDPVLFDIDHESISVTESAYMDAIPFLEEVRVAVFDLGADSAPGPDGFTGSFYRQCWDIISRDLFNAISNCWLGTVLNKLISEEEVAFMKGRNIHEIIALASELINEINTEKKHGNVGLKLDIAQAFETNMLVLYERASGQCVNYAKSKFYFGADRISRVIVIYNYLGMERAMFPDKCLGIQLKPGIIRHIHVHKVVEKIMDKLAGWKGKLLSFQARLVLIKSVISSYVIHSMDVYKWTCTFIKQVERAIRDFLWSRNAEKRKYFMVLCDDLCLSKSEGGLGIKKLNDINRAMLMNLWISIRDSNKIWARFLKAKYFKINSNLINYKLGSSVFPGIRLVYNFVQKHTRSIISNGANTSLFFDNLRGDFSIAQRLCITSKGPNDFKAKVSDIIFDGAWVIPEKTRDLMIRCNIDVDNLTVIAGGEDYKIWDLDNKGVFSVKSAKAALKMPAEVVPYANLFTRQIMHPTLSVQY